MTAIYNSYVDKDAKGVPLDSERVILRYFEQTLATAMAKDQKAAARRNEVGLLDFDPFLEAQDWEVEAFNIDIALADIAAGKAEATAKFVNFGEAITVVLDLALGEPPEPTGIDRWNNDPLHSKAAPRQKSN